MVEIRRLHRRRRVAPPAGGSVLATTSPSQPVAAPGLLLGAVLAGTCLCSAPAQAQDATWLANPGSGDFNTAANWSPATVPTGTAFFGTSNTTALSFSADTNFGGWTFNAGASNYTFTNGQNLNFDGAGIIVNGGSAAITNNNTGLIVFFNSSTAGSATIDNTGSIAFFNSSTAGSATITNGGNLQFRQNSTAGSATITNNIGSITFLESSTAGSATITNNANLNFTGTSSTAGSATISTTSTWDSSQAARPAARPLPTPTRCNFTTPPRLAAPASPTTTN